MFFYKAPDVQQDNTFQQDKDTLHLLKILLISCQKLGIPAITKSLAFYFFHRLNHLKFRHLDNAGEPLPKTPQILACLSLAMKINEHVKKYKEISSIVLQVMEVKEEIANLKDYMMMYELLLQEDIYFIQDWDSPFRFLLKIVLDLGGDEKLAKRAWKITNESYFCNICVLVVPQAIAIGAIYLAWRLEGLDKPSLRLTNALVSKYATDLIQVKHVCIQILNLYQQTDFLSSDDKMKCHLILEEIQHAKSREYSGDGSVDQKRRFDNFQRTKIQDERRNFNSFNPRYGPNDPLHKRHYNPTDAPKDYRHPSSSFSSTKSKYGSHRSSDYHKTYSPEKHYHKRGYGDSYESSRSREYEKSSKKKYSSTESYDSDDDYRRNKSEDRDDDYRRIKSEDLDDSRSRSGRGRNDYGHDDRHDYGHDDKHSSRYSRHDSRHSSGRNTESPESSKKHDNYRDDRYSNSRRESGSSYHSQSHYKTR